MQLRARDHLGHGRREPAERAGVEVVAVAVGHEHRGERRQAVGRQAERLLLADHPARLEPRVDDDSRPAHLEDEGGVHDARHAEIGIRGMVDGAAGEGDGGAGRGERGRHEEAVRPHQTLPSWRSAS